MGIEVAPDVILRVQGIEHHVWHIHSEVLKKAAGALQFKSATNQVNNSCRAHDGYSSKYKVYPSITTLEIDWPEAFSNASGSAEETVCATLLLVYHRGGSSKSAPWTEPGAVTQALRTLVGCQKAPHVIIESFLHNALRAFERACNPTIEDLRSIRQKSGSTANLVELISKAMDLCGQALSLNRQQIRYQQHQELQCKHLEQDCPPGQHQHHKDKENFSFVKVVKVTSETDPFDNGCVISEAKRCDNIVDRHSVPDKSHSKSPNQVQTAQTNNTSTRDQTEQKELSLVLQHSSAKETHSREELNTPQEFGEHEKGATKQCVTDDVSSERDLADVLQQLAGAHRKVARLSRLLEVKLQDNVRMGEHLQRIEDQNRRLVERNAALQADYKRKNEEDKSSANRAIKDSKIQAAQAKKPKPPTSKQSSHHPYSRKSQAPRCAAGNEGNVLHTRIARACQAGSSHIHVPSSAHTDVKSSSPKYQSKKPTPSIANPCVKRGNP